MRKASRWGPEAAITLVKTGRGKKLVLQQSSLIADLQRHEQQFLAGRQALYGKMQAVSTLTQLAGGSVSLLLLGFSFALLQSRLRQKERWGQQLEAQVNARTQELEESRAGLERQAQQLASFNQKLEETVRERTVKQMTENYGGRIEVESRLDEGTQFKVYFPG